MEDYTAIIYVCCWGQIKIFVIGKRMICNTADDKKVLVLYLGDKQKVTLHQKYNHKIMICTKESIKKSIKILQPS